MKWADIQVKWTGNEMGWQKGKIFILKRWAGMLIWTGMKRCKIERDGLVQRERENDMLR